MASQQHSGNATGTCHVGRRRHQRVTLTRATRPDAPGMAMSPPGATTRAAGAAFPLASVSLPPALRLARDDHRRRPPAHRPRRQERPARARHAFGRRAGDVQRDRQRRHPPRRDRRRDRRREPVRGRGEDYNTTPTAQGARCDYTRPRPCPDLKNETIAASPAIAGRRTLLVRVTDAAGNQTVSAPFAVDGARPGQRRGRRRRRAPRRGLPRPHLPRPAARRASGSASCARPRRSAGATARGCAGILRSAAGQPVAGAGAAAAGARAAAWVASTSIAARATTGADGRFTFRFPRGASRRLPRSPTAPTRATRA